jgi:Transposase DDE domain
MSKAVESTIVNPSSSTSTPLLEDVFFAPISQALQVPGITRGCAVFDDTSFVTLALLRVLENSKTGRDFIQTHGIPTVPGLTRSNYFDGLASERRLEMFIALEQELQRQQLPMLRAHDDRLALFSELNQIEIWAGDGHCIAHATHDSRNEKGAYNPVSAIYKFDLRTGWMRFIDLVRPTARGIEHEITTLKRQDKQDLRCGAGKGQSTLMVYDTAIVDFQYAYNLKQSKSIYILTGWKNNFVPLTILPREIDHSNPANALVIRDETIYFNNTPGLWRRITATCPDSDETYVTLTNQMTLSPGALNQCRRLRWNIEKAFDQQEQKLDERKAWTASETGKRIQAIAMTIVHNLLRLFEAKLKGEEGIEDTKVIKAWQKDLTKRVEKAREAGRQLPVNLYQALYRPTEVSLQFIRWLRISLTRPTCYRQAIEQLRPLMLAYL